MICFHSCPPPPPTPAPTLRRSVYSFSFPHCEHVFSCCHLPIQPGGCAETHQRQPEPVSLHGGLPPAGFKSRLSSGLGAFVLAPCLAGGLQSADDSAELVQSQTVRGSRWLKRPLTLITGFFNTGVSLWPGTPFFFARF